MSVVLQKVIWLLGLTGAVLSFAFNPHCLVAGASLSTRPGLNPQPYVPETGLYGVQPEHLEHLTSIVQKHLGDAIIEVYGIGSRASGKRSPGKGTSGPIEGSDLDLLVHVKNREGLHRAYGGLYDEMAKANLPFRVELHIVSSDTGKPFDGNIAVAYPAGDPAYYPIINLAKEVDPAKRAAAVAIPVRLPELIR